MSQAQALHIQLRPSSNLVRLGLAWLISTPNWNEQGIAEKSLLEITPLTKS